MNQEVSVTVSRLGVESVEVDGMCIEAKRREVEEMES